MKLEPDTHLEEAAPKIVIATPPNSPADDSDQPMRDTLNAPSEGLQWRWVSVMGGYLCSQSEASGMIHKSLHSFKPSSALQVPPPKPNRLQHVGPIDLPSFQERPLKSRGQPSGRRERHQRERAESRSHDEKVSQDIIHMGYYGPTGVMDQYSATFIEKLTRSLHDLKEDQKTNLCADSMDNDETLVLEPKGPALEAAVIARPLTT